MERALTPGASGRRGNSQTSPPWMAPCMRMMGPLTEPAMAFVTVAATEAMPSALAMPVWWAVSTTAAMPEADVMAGAGAGATMASARILLAALPSAPTCSKCIEFIMHKQRCETSQPWQRLQCRRPVSSGVSLAPTVDP